MRPTSLKPARYSAVTNAVEVQPKNTSETQVGLVNKEDSEAELKNLTESRLKLIGEREFILQNEEVSPPSHSGSTFEARRYAPSTHSSSSSISSVRHSHEKHTPNSYHHNASSKTPERMNKSNVGNLNSSPELFEPPNRVTPRGFSLASEDTKQINRTSSAKILLGQRTPSGTPGSTNSTFSDTKSLEKHLAESRERLKVQLNKSRETLKAMGITMYKEDYSHKDLDYYPSEAYTSPEDVFQPRNKHIDNMSDSRKEMVMYFQKRFIYIDTHLNFQVSLECNIHIYAHIFAFLPIA